MNVVDGIVVSVAATGSIASLNTTCGFTFTGTDAVPAGGETVTTNGAEPSAVPVVRKLQENPEPPPVTLYADRYHV